MPNKTSALNLYDHQTSNMKLFTSPITTTLKDKIMNEMYYRRYLPERAKKVILEKYRWLIEYVKEKPELDFQITFNCDKEGTGDNKTIPDKNRGTSRFSIYRGTSRILSFEFSNDCTLKKIDAADSYMQNCSPADGFFSPEGVQKNPIPNMDAYLKKINSRIDKYGRYYINKDGRMEGFFQNLLNRRYTLTPQKEDDFIIFDREFEFGFSCKEQEKEWNFEASELIDKLRNKAKSDGVVFNSTYDKKDGFDEIDGIGINKEGDLIILEVKHPRNHEGIAYGPMQVRYYIEQLKKALGDDSFNTEFFESIKRIVKQKQSMGILSLPQNWTMPTKLSGRIIPYLVVGSQSKDDAPNLSKEMKKRFYGVKKFFNDESFPLQVKVCASASELDGTLEDYTIQ